MSPYPARIDVHHHAIPSFYGRILEEHGHRPGGIPVPDWTPEKSLRLMNRNGIAISILSVSTPGAVLADGPAPRLLARQLNEHLAELVADSRLASASSRP